MNTLLELSHHDPELRQRLCAGLARMERRLRNALEAATRRGELAAGRDIDATTAFLMNNIWGIRVMCRSRPSRQVLQGVVATVLGALRP